MQPERDDPEPGGQATLAAVLGDPGSFPLLCHEDPKPEPLLDLLKDRRVSLAAHQCLRGCGQQLALKQAQRGRMMQDTTEGEVQVFYRKLRGIRARRAPLLEVAGEVLGGQRQARPAKLTPGDQALGRGWMHSVTMVP